MADFSVTSSGNPWFPLGPPPSEVNGSARSLTAVVLMADFSAIVKPLAWDTGHFGIRMGELVPPPAPRGEPEAAIVRTALADARRQGFQQLMCRAAPRDVPLIHALEAEGFRLMDTLVTMALDLTRPLPPLDPTKPWHARGFYAAEIRQAIPADSVALMAIARNAFSDPQIWLDRFHADPRLPRGRADALYAEWVKNSVEPPTPADSMADCVFVAGPAGGSIAGFITCRRARGSEPARVLLNAVDVWARRHGVYRALVLWTLEWFREQREPVVTVRTSVASQAVQRTWTRLGAVPICVEHTFHWWAS